MMSLPAQFRELQHLSPQQWLDRASRTVPQALSALLVVAIAWQLVELTWLALDRPDEGSAVTLAPAPVSTGARRGIDVQAIVGAHLFGVPELEVQAPEEAPQTQMNLILSAVFAADDPAKGLAIIGESPQSAKVYTVGENIRNAAGTRLHAVYADRVILDRAGRLEALALPKRNTAAIAINRAAPPPPAGAQFADNLRRVAETNPGALAEVVRPQPVFANGVQRGYRVYPGRNRQQFARLGLQPGDLVLSINGTPLDDPRRGMEIFNTMGASDRVNVTIERGGQTQEVTLNTAQISLPDPSSGETEERPGIQQQQPVPPSAPMQE